jgi:predicted SnoaL-like aldol condensation-catalyzing enzyme
MPVRISGKAVFVEAEVANMQPSNTPKRLVCRYVDEILNGKQVDLLDEVFSPLYLDHDPVFPGNTGRKAIHSFIQILSQDHFDVWFTLEDALAEGDRIAYRLFGEGTGLLPPTVALPLQWRQFFTHERNLRDSTKRHLLIEGIGIYRVAHGRLREHWGLRKIAVERLTD